MPLANTMKLLLAKVFGASALSKVTPLVGGFTMWAVIQAQVESSPWVEIWRMLLTLGIGIFVTLCGVIWRDMNRRQEEQEQIQKARHEENKIEIHAVVDKQNRMIGALVALAVGMQKEGHNGGERLAEALRAILE